MPKSSTRYLVASKNRRAKKTHTGKPSWRPHGGSCEARLGLWGLTCSVSEALPGTLTRVPARVQAHVD
eukprot:4207524-Pyramimonas_sp.AAC.1